MHGGSIDRGSTHDDLRRAFISAGVAIAQEYRSASTETTQALFDWHGARVDLRQIDTRWLFENRILLVGRK